MLLQAKRSALSPGYSGYLLAQAMYQVEVEAAEASSLPDRTVARMTAACRTPKSGLA